MMCAPSPHSPSKTGVNALLEGEGWGEGLQTLVCPPPSPGACGSDLSPTGRGEDIVRDDSIKSGEALKHDPEKWGLVFGEDHAPNEVKTGSRDAGSREESASNYKLKSFAMPMTR